MLDTVLGLLSSLVISPLLFCYACLLNDRWRIPRWAMAVLTVLSGFSAQLIAGIPNTAVWFRICLIELCNILALYLCSRARDLRFLFVLCTAGLFDFMMTAACSIFAYPLGIHRLLLRLFMDGLVLGLGARFFRPVFLDVFRSSKRGWGLLSLFPVSLTGVFAVILIQPGFMQRYTQPAIRWITGIFSALAIVVYVVFFRFFQMFHDKRQAELRSHILRTQFRALERQTEEYRAVEERLRIFRHDLRHYLHMLSVCIEEGDTDSALLLLEHIDRLQREARQPVYGGDG